VSYVGRGPVERSGDAFTRAGLKAREQGFSSADDLAALASEALAQAEDMERGAIAPRMPEAPQQVAQQQQQPQPKKK
jgi:hypothetical protein